MNMQGLKKPKKKHAQTWFLHPILFISESIGAYQHVAYKYISIEQYLSYPHLSTE